MTHLKHNPNAKALGFLFPENLSQRLMGLEETKIINNVGRRIGIVFAEEDFIWINTINPVTHLKNIP
jgi:hypothetical protein